HSATTMPAVSPRSSGVKARRGENMGLSAQQRQEVKEIAELTTRQFFDTYLNEIFPRQLAAVVKAHDEAANAHGGIRGKFSQFKFTIVGFIIAGGAGAGVNQLLSVLT